MIRNPAPVKSLILCVVAAALLTACGGSKPLVQDSLDLKTGVTVTRATDSVIFFRNRSAYAANDREYIYLGPIEINKMGQRSYYLWLGIWNQSEDVKMAPTQNDFESVVILADREPLDLQVMGWNPAKIGMSEPVYVKPVESAIDAYYGVTIDQIRVIAEARDLEIRTGPSEREHFQPWESSEAATDGLRAFVLSVE